MPCKGLLWPNKYISDLVYVTSAHEGYKVKGRRYPKGLGFGPRLLPGEVGSLQFHLPVRQLLGQLLEADRLASGASSAIHLLCDPQQIT